MFSFALKNMKVRWVRILLVALSIIISAGVGVLAFNTANQVSDGISGTAGYYSAIVGPAGSSTQLAMNTMYFTDSPLGTIPYSVISTLEQDARVTKVIPFAMADSYNGAAVVGTSDAYLESKELAEGQLFDNAASCQAVVGSAVASANGLKIGDQLYTSHSVGEEHKTPLTVVGILKQTHTVYDNVLFTELKTIWDLHGEEHDHDHEEGEDHNHEEGEDHDHEEHEDHGHEEGEEHEEHDHAEMNGMVCAILVKTKNPSYAMTLVNDYNGKIYTERDGDSFQLQAIEPMSTVRGVLEEANTTKYIVFILCGIILAMNILVIVIITLLNMYHSAKEIALMRLIGISMGRINLVYLIQNALTGAVSILLAFGLSRLCMVFMKDYVAAMGVVLNAGKVYPLEIVILLAVFLISILPTVICTAVMARSDSAK